MGQPYDDSQMILRQSLSKKQKVYEKKNQNIFKLDARHLQLQAPFCCHRIITVCRTALNLLQQNNYESIST